MSQRELACNQSFQDHHTYSESSVWLQFKTIFEVKLSYWFQSVLCPRRPEEWTCRVSYPVSPTNGCSKTIFQLELYWFEGSVHVRPQKNMMRLSFPLITAELPAIKRPSSECNYHIDFEFCLPRNLSIECTEFLLQCHQQTTFSRPSFKQNYCNNSKPCVPWDLNNKHPSQSLYPYKLTFRAAVVVGFYSISICPHINLPLGVVVSWGLLLVPYI